MPHTKRKGIVKGQTPVARTSSPSQQTIERFTTLIPTTKASDSELRTEGGALVLSDLETSLSPPNNRPPCPAFQEQSTEIQTHTEVVQGQISHGVDSIQNAEGTTLEGNPPMEITLQAIWEALQGLNQSVLNSARETSQLVSKIDSLTCSFEKTKQESGLQMQQIQQEVKTLKTITESLTVDKIIIHKKIEQFENFNRRLNLRLLNFPWLKNMSSTEMFKKYLQDVLLFPASAIPPLNKTYYLPIPVQAEPGDSDDRLDHLKRLPLDQHTTQEPLDISLILETSFSEIEQRRTLLVSFVFEQDLNSVLKLYFRNSLKIFCGQRIWVYPDVCKTTQDRRKKFLTFREETRALGATFLLAYPCKCLIKYMGIKYIFYDPEHLKAFLEMKKLTVKPKE